MASGGSSQRPDESELDCFDENIAAAYAARQLSAAEWARVDEHASRCDRCRRMLSATLTDDGERSEERIRLRGSTIGRYVVLDCLGAGGMSVVYRAYDPDLDRKVAIKLLHRRNGPVEEEGGLAREAKAAAKVVHPNIVAMYDLGTSSAERYIVMELVEGENLRQWLAAEKRTWRQILGVFRQAGEGIAAAHRQGLIHLDLKPDNILVGRDGLVRVADFGLAKLASVGRTANDQTAGTPAYMAPEQRAGIVVARGDQYSYCLSFHEALCGTRELTAETSNRRRVPRWLARIVRRGAAPDPAQRFASMTALLRAIARVRLLRRLVLAAAATLVLAAVVMVLARQSKHQPPWWEPGVGAARDAGLLLGRHDYTDGWYCGVSPVFSRGLSGVRWRDPALFDPEGLYEVVGATVYAIGHCIHGCDEGPLGVPAHCNFSPGFDPLLRIPIGKYRRFCGGPGSAIGIESGVAGMGPGTYALYRQAWVSQNLFYTVFVDRGASWQECP